MSKILYCLLAAAALLFAPVQARSESDLESLIEGAQKSIGEQDVKNAEWFICRYVGLLVNEGSERHTFADIEPYLSELGLKPTAFISGKYSRSFLSWFISSTYAQWGVPEEFTDAGNRKAVVALGTNSGYYASVEGSPVIEVWAIIGGDGGVESTPLDLIDRGPVLSVGRRAGTNAAAVECTISTGENYYQHFWNPVVTDLDSDGILEILLRYNVAMADGFYQKLSVYRLERDRLVLLDSLEGMAEGVARRVSGNIFETAEGDARSPEKTGHLGYDIHRITRHVFKKDRFEKTGETRQVKHLLWSEEYKKYY